MTTEYYLALAAAFVRSKINATNITRTMRKQLIDLFLSYGAHVHIVYLDAPFDTILQRNHDRQNNVPEQVIYKLLNKLEIPDVTEEHRVEWIHEIPTTSSLYP